jgi:hypothetical protein
MHSILVLSVREEFFQTEAGGRTEATKVTEEKFGPSLRARFLPSHGARADTLEIQFAKLFCVLSGARTFMLLHDPLETD